MPTPTDIHTTSAHTHILIHTRRHTPTPVYTHQHASMHTRAHAVTHMHKYTHKLIFMYKWTLTQVYIHVNTPSTREQRNIRANTCRHFHTQAYMCAQASARRKDPETTTESQVLVVLGCVVGAMSHGTGGWHSRAGLAGLRTLIDPVRTHLSSSCRHWGPGPTLRSCHTPTP